MPTFALPGATVREVRATDAAALAVMMAEPNVCEFVAAPVLAVAAVSRLIAWMREERRRERLVCFVIVPRDTGKASGLFQMWPVGRGSGVVEIGFALERRLWGTGLFAECARAVITFAIEHLAVHRIEARAAADNARGLAALAKLGAIREGTMRECFRIGERAADHEMWSILAHEWRQHSASPDMQVQP
jgi:RimJ/RimL family protein N-acetyltransferase